VTLQAVRVVYIVPSDAHPWPDIRRRATEALQGIQQFFADEMSRLGYGPKTFAIAYDSDDRLLFRQLNTPHTKAQFEEGRNSAIRLCRQIAGAPDKHYAELCFIEAYSIEHGVVSGAIAGTRHQRSCLSSLHLKLALPEWLKSEDGYAGQTFAWISSEPMGETTLSWNGRGAKLGDVAGAGFGLIAHELAHCFGLDHHRSEDDRRERQGHLMGKGVRGFRGYFRPDLTADRCVLSVQDAKLLNSSPFFEVRQLGPRGKDVLPAK
jgi:hypothetical protein